LQGATHTGTLTPALGSPLLPYCPSIAGSSAVTCESPRWKQDMVLGDMGLGPRHDLILSLQEVQ